MLGSADAPYTSNRSLLKVIHDNLLSNNPPAPGPPLPPPDHPTPSPAPPPPPPPPVPWPPGPHNPGTPPPQPWDATKAYAVGDQVTYQGHTYQCTIAHTAQVDWTPTAAVSLWKLVS